MIIQNLNDASYKKGFSTLFAGLSSEAREDPSWIEYSTVLVPYLYDWDGSSTVFFVYWERWKKLRLGAASHSRSKLHESGLTNTSTL